jgi:hypothetical protein
MSGALGPRGVRGGRPHAAAPATLNATYRRFLKEQEPARKEEAGKDLIRAIFGKDALAGDSLL